MNGLGIAAGAVPLLGGLATLALLLFLLASWLGRWPIWLTAYGITVLALLVAFFFRDPARPGERGPLLFLSPADGRVVSVERVTEPDYLQGDALRVTIYLSLLDVHGQRSPVDGVVDYVERRAHRRGPMAPRVPEDQATGLGLSTGEVRVLVRHVSGSLAARMESYVEEGERVDQGQRIGRIHSGSRVEVYLPPDVEPLVADGDRVRAGTTVLARTPPNQPADRERRP